MKKKIQTYFSAWRAVRNQKPKKEKDGLVKKTKWSEEKKFSKYLHFQKEPKKKELRSIKK